MVPTEPGEPYRIVTQWGRIGGRLRRREELIATRASALDRLTQRLQERRSRGYLLTQLSDGHPLSKWLEETDFPSAPTNGVRQLSLFDVADDEELGVGSPQLTLF